MTWTKYKSILRLDSETVVFEQIQEDWIISYFFLLLSSLEFYLLFDMKWDIYLGN